MVKKNNTSADGVLFSYPNFIILFFLSAVGCRPQSESNTQGWGLPLASYGGNTLQLCYESRFNADLELVEVTRSLFAFAEREFSRTNLTLQGFGPCGQKTSAKEIRMSWITAEDFGTNKEDIEDLEGLEGMSKFGNVFLYGPLIVLQQFVPSPIKAEPTLILNAYQFKRVSNESSTSNAISFFKSFFLHEMGHAVGMLHEHAQADSKCNLPGKLPGKVPETFQYHIEKWRNAGIRPILVGTSYDPYSIMDYCYLLSRGRIVAIGFSSHDILTVNALYPKVNEQPIQTVQSQTGQPQTGQPQVGQGQIDSPVALPQKNSGSSVCNMQQLKICLDYKGGDACYPKWGCVKP